jgi:hypothetical protein
MIILQTLLAGGHFLASSKLIATSRESAKGPAYYRRAGLLLIATES